MCLCRKIGCFGVYKCSLFIFECQKYGANLFKISREFGPFDARGLQRCLFVICRLLVQGEDGLE